MTKEIITEERLEIFEKEMIKIMEKPGPLIPGLQAAQNIFGCVPISVQKIISGYVKESVGKINGVVTFYSQFSLEPKGDTIVSVCMGTACYVRGSNVILDKTVQITNCEAGKTSDDGKYSIVATRCIGACGLAPVITVNDEVHGNLSVVDVPNLIGGENENKQ